MRRNFKSEIKRDREVRSVVNKKWRVIDHSPEREREKERERNREREGKREKEKNGIASGAYLETSKSPTGVS